MLFNPFLIIIIIIIIMFQSHLMLNEYHSLGSISTLKKWIILFFQKMKILKFEIIIISIIYYYLVIWVINEFIQSITYDNYDDFNMSTSYFHKI
jgi:hypothetical protein